MEQPTKRFTRSRRDRILGGVCGGIAEYFSIDPTLVRVVVVVLALWKGWVVFLYMILWWVMPEADASVSGDDRVKQVTEEMKNAAQRAARTITGDRSRMTMRFVIGGLLILIGAAALIQPYVSWHFYRWEYLWPAVIVVIGVLIMFRRSS